MGLYSNMCFSTLKRNIKIIPKFACTDMIADNLYHLSFPVPFEPTRDKTNKMACAASEDSDQPGHPPSLIRVFAVRMKKAWGGCPG